LDENDRVQLFGTINSSRKLSKTPIVDSRIILKSSIFHHLSEKTVFHHLSAAFSGFRRGKAVAKASVFDRCATEEQKKALWNGI